MGLIPGEQCSFVLKIGESEVLKKLSLAMCVGVCLCAHRGRSTGLGLLLCEFQLFQRRDVFVNLFIWCCSRILLKRISAGGSSDGQKDVSVANSSKGSSGGGSSFLTFLCPLLKLLGVRTLPHFQN